MKKKLIRIAIISIILIVFFIIFMKYAPTINKTNIKKATITEIANMDKDKNLSSHQINKIIDFINSTKKTRKIGIEKGWHYKVIIERGNYNTEITLIGDQLSIDGSNYTSTDVTKKFQKLLFKMEVYNEKNSVIN